MVTIKNMGRAANFMYQVANGIAYAKKHGLEFSVPAISRDQKWHPVYFPHLVNPRFNSSLSNILIQERTHAYHEIDFKESYRMDNIVLEGYWQSYKYFDWCIEDIRKAFGFNYTTIQGVCGLHIRRGDFLQYPDKHILPPAVYYNIAFKYIIKEKNINHVKIFSDDIPWCKENYENGLHGCTYEFSEGKTELQDFEELMNCEAIVCAASTFSVLAGTLSTTPNKMVVVPDESNFFGPVGRGLDLSTMYPHHFLKIAY